MLDGGKKEILQHPVDRADNQRNKGRAHSSSQPKQIQFHIQSSRFPTRDAQEGVRAVWAGAVGREDGGWREGGGCWGGGVKRSSECWPELAGWL